MHITASPPGGFSRFSPSSEPGNADYPGCTGRGNSGLLLPSGGLRHALLLGEYCDFAVFADALGLHRAMPLEMCAFLDRKHGRRDVPAHFRRGADLDSLGGNDISADLARHRYRDRAYLGRDHGSLADIEGVFRGDLAIDLAVDSRGTFERDLAGDFRSTIEIRASLRRSRTVGSWSRRGERRGRRCGRRRRYGRTW